MRTKNGVTIQMLYELIDKTRVEFNQKIDKLTDYYMQLESGRLTTLEKAFSNMQGKIYATVGIIAFIISAVITIIGFYFMKENFAHNLELPPENTLWLMDPPEGSLLAIENSTGDQIGFSKILKSELSSSNRKKTVQEKYIL